MKKITFTHRISTPQGHGEVEIRGYQFTWNKAEFVVHRYHDLRTGVSPYSWTVSELTSGVWIGIIEETRNTAIKEALTMLEKQGLYNLEQCITQKKKELGLIPLTIKDKAKKIMQSSKQAQAQDHQESMDYQLAKMAGYIN